MSQKKITNNQKKLRDKFIKKGVKMEEEEMKELLSQLFQCESPFINSAGKSTFFNFTAQEINDKLG